MRASMPQNAGSPISCVCKMLKRILRKDEIDCRTARLIKLCQEEKWEKKSVSLHPEMIFHNTRIIVVWSISHWFFSPCRARSYLRATWIQNITLSLSLLDPFAFKRMNMEKVFRKTISFPRYWISIFKVHATFSSIIFLLPPLSPIFRDCLETCLIGELIVMPELGRSVTFECLASATSFDWKMDTILTCHKSCVISLETGDKSS